MSFQKKAAIEKITTMKFKALIMSCLLVLNLTAVMAQTELASATETTAETTTETTTTEQETSTVSGVILDAVHDKGIELYLHIQDTDRQDYYLSSSPTEASYEKLPELPKGYLVGKKMEVTYSEKKQKLLTEWFPLQTNETLVSRGKALDNSITVYSLKGEQTNVIDNGIDYTITVKLSSGKEVAYIAEKDVFGDNDPIMQNGKLVKISYIEENTLIIEDFKMVK